MRTSRAAAAAAFTSDGDGSPTCPIKEAALLRDVTGVTGQPR